MTAFHIHRQHGQKQSKVWMILLIPFFLLLALGAFAYIWFTMSLAPLSGSQQEVVVTIPVGASAPEIGETLEDMEIIRSALSFDVYTRINGSRDVLQAGSYRFSPTESVQRIVERIVSGDVATDLFTILPAQRLDQVKASFLSAGYSQAEVAEAFRPENYTNHPALVGKPVNANLEGYLYPNSYQKTDTTTVNEIIKASLDEMAEALSPDLQAEFSMQGLSVFEAVTIASIVEREVSSSEDRAIVAQVFLKRYKEGIMLGSDPTALYGALVAGIEPSVRADTPYNTRIYTGLPPGPINNVSTASLFAVARPADTEYLFFVSGDDGNTYFSNTLAEHEALTARYCTELCRSY
jgi:UPF0755 protein